jgi:hypothetical protein
MRARLIDLRCQAFAVAQRLDSRYCVMISQPPSARQQPHIMPVLAVMGNINFAMPHFNGLHTLLSSAFAVATSVLTDYGIDAAKPGRIRH